MKFFYFSTLLTLLLFCTCLHAQPPSSTDVELRAISDKLVKRLNLAEFRGAMIVFDFTNASGEPTVLGAYIARELRSQILDSDRMFTIKDPASDPQSKKLWDAAGTVFKTVTQEAGVVINDRKSVEAIQALGQNTQAFFRPSSKDRSLRKVDAILDGTITDMGETFRINVDVKTTKRSEYLVSVKGDLSKTDALTRLSGKPMEEENLAVASSSRPGRSSRSGTKAPLVFEKQHLKFELLECIETGGGRYLECKLRITSEGKDTNLSLIKNKSKIYNQDNGKEFEPTSVNISDVTNSGGGWTTKSLLRDLPVSSVITFEPSESISVISRFQLQCYTDELKYFIVDISDIFVE